MSETLLQPRGRGGPTTEARRRTRSGWSLPPDLLADTRKRLMVLALLLAFAFSVGNFVGPIIAGPEVIAHILGSPFLWVPGAISITLSIVVALLCRNAKIPARRLLALGLAFEVVTSWGISAAEYGHFYAPMQYRPGDFGGFGLSWVSVWVVLFTVVVPTRPRRALIAALLSVASVPIVVANTIAHADVIAVVPNAREFYTAFIQPYLIVVLMAYVGARIVYKLGTDISRALEMGSYRLTRMLGRGGMGEVWLARHRMLARPAAIKLVNPELLGAADPAERETMVKRFEREAQATAAMRSPHTVDLFDFGAAEDGTFYYVMELLDGYDLDTLIKRFGPVPAERAIFLLRQVCHSLAEAHERGLIHRDIKPANVYVCRYGRDADYVKVLDFGLVKNRRPGEDPGLTQTAFAGGTPAHMAPEQALGEDVDARTDLYALGCVAYWLVTGRLVFESETPLGMIADHARTPPLPPSMKGELPIPPELETVIMRCLEKDPAGRPQSAQELALALEACPAADDWTNERAWAWWALHGPDPLIESDGSGRPPRVEARVVEGAVP